MFPSSVISPPASNRSGPQPRVELRPAGIVGSYGPEAVALARRAGLVLDPWQCDSLDLALSFRADGKWACFEYAEWIPRQNGKGAVFEARALAGMFLLGEKLLMWSAHLYDTAEEAFLRMDQLMSNLVDCEFIGRGVIKPMYANGGQGFYRTDTKQRIKFHARTAKGGRGWSGDTIFIDEALGLDKSQVGSLMPTMAARPNPQVLYASTPPLSGDTSEPMYDLRERGEVDPSGEVSLGYRDWGAAGDIETILKLPESERRAFLTDRARWRATNPAWGYRITEEFTLNELRSMGEKNFLREREGVWHKRIGGGGAIDTAIWKGLADPESRRAGRVAIAVDISPQRDYAAIVVYGPRADGLGHVQLLDYRAGTEWIVGRLVEHRDVLDPVAIGMGKGTYESLKGELTKAGLVEPEKDAAPTPGQLAVTSHTDMAAACGQIIDAVRQRSIRHLDESTLKDSVAGAKTRQVGEVLAWVRKDNGQDTSPLVAMTVARWSYLVREPLVRQTYNALNNIW